MRMFSLLSVLTVSSLALAGGGKALIYPGALTAAQLKAGGISSGIDGEDLADTPVSDIMPVGGGNTVHLELDVTAGTTARVDVTCEQSSDGTNFTWIPHCTDSQPKICVKDELRFSIASVVDHTVTIENSPAYLRCTFDDAADGTGTLVLRGSVIGS